MKAIEAQDRKNRLDRRRLGIALVAAIVFHLWLFYFTFPEMSGLVYVKERRGPVRIKDWRPPPREKPKVKPPPKTQVKKAAIIPVPDPTPDEPEEIQLLEEEPPIEIPEEVDFVWGIPQAPEVGQEGPEEARIYNPYEVSQEPEYIYTPKPDYPELARIAGVEAIVVLELIVDENGGIQHAEVLYATGGKFKDKFAQEAVRVAYKYKCKPAIQSGHPVPCRAKFTVRFRLTD